MRVLVDTCVWSKVLRRKTPDQNLAALIEDLIRDGRIVLIGPIRQELLSGVPNPSQFEMSPQGARFLRGCPPPNGAFRPSRRIQQPMPQEGHPRFHHRFPDLRRGRRRGAPDPDDRLRLPPLRQAPPHPPLRRHRLTIAGHESRTCNRETREIRERRRTDRLTRSHEVKANRRPARPLWLCGFV